MLSWRLIRRCVPALLAVALVLSGLVLSSTQGPLANNTSSAVADRVFPPPQDAEPAPAPKGPKPVVRTKETAVPKASAGAAKDVVAELPQTRTTSYGMVGVTWSADTTERDISVAIRSLVKGSWTPWETLENDDDAPGDAGRPGTEPIWVGEAEGVAVRVSSPSQTRPDDIKVLTIDPGGVNEAAATTVTSAAYTTSGVMNGTAHASTAATVGDGTPSYTPRPPIIMRSAWGAAAGGTCSSPLTGSSTRGVVVHHTAGSNSYSKADAAKIVRGVQAYHVKGHDWCDIGYNFLVDKYGQIFEGRKGGIDRSVRAAHSGNGEVNTYAMGVSLMGNYDKVQPSAALKTSVVKLVGWRMGTNYMKAKGTYKVAEKNLTLNLIAGHRNVVGTACPGKYVYAWLSAKGGLRDRVETYISHYRSDIRTRAAALGPAFTGPVYIGEAAVTGGRLTRFGKGYMLAKTGVGATFLSFAAGFQSTYWGLGAVKSPLGYPKSDSPAVVANGTYAQRFEHGSIFAVRAGSKISDFALWGPIASTYASLNEAKGALGAPVSSVLTVAAGTRTNFVKGSIRYYAATKKTIVYDLAGRVMAGTAPATQPTSVDTVIIPSSRTVTVKGHGYGHGIGMSQYGAQGAARAGVTYRPILATYYPGTTLAKKTGNIRVLISKDTTVSVVVAGRSSMTFRTVSDGKKVTLPTTISGSTVKQWRIMPQSSNKKKSTLQYKTTGSWKTYASKVWTGDAQFEATAMRLILPDGSWAAYRGILRSSVPKAGSTDRNTVNVLPIESYLLGVVPAEMPSSWMPEALKAQAIAARTYAVRGLVPSRYYDMCDTTSCQVYRGYSAETKATNAAISATKTIILTYAGKPAFTQFSSSSGGFTAPGSQPYLKAVADPRDDWSGNANHDWTKAVSATTIQKAYPSIGTLKELKITKRNGHGDWGGRVTTVSLVGSKKTVSISGDDARWSFGLRSNWFRFN